MKAFRNALNIFLWLVVVVAGTSTFTTLLSAARYEVAGIKIEVRVAPEIRGGTELSLPPFGEITAKTHTVPVKLGVVVHGVNQSKIAEALNHSTSASSYFDLVEKDARQVGGRFLLRLVVLSAIGGLLSSLALTRRWWKLVLASLAGIALVSIVASAIYLQFSAEAFAQPQLSGPLGSAPWIAVAIEKRLNPLETLREDVQLIARNLRNFAAKVEEWQPVVAEKGTVRVLVVSDIHNNPAAFSLINRMVKDFRVDLVIDAGDITDFGTPIEASLLGQLRTIDRPYLYVPGNHDTSEVLEVMKALPNVTVLEGNTVSTNGLVVYGHADPLAYDSRVEPLPNSEIVKFSRQLEKQVDASSEKPLIVAVHDGRMAATVIGKVPIVIRGHTHRPAIIRRGETTVIDAGSTGATGIRTFQTEQPQKLDFTLALLYIDPQEQKLIAVDSVEVEGLEGNFVLKRTLVNGK